MSQLLRILSAETGLFEIDLRQIIATAPRRYKVYNIPKRSGGFREIAQPAREVKLLQRVLMERVLKDKLQIHRAASAYREGLSIRDNAEAHAGITPILKMDFKDFFPSIRSLDWEAYCARHQIFANEDVLLSSFILFRRSRGEKLLKLSIGAPTSPMLSNALLFDFDTLVADQASRRNISYTRYADDMTFSGQRIGMLKDMIKVVEQAARQTERPQLVVNEAKTTFVTASRRRTVTGVILANDGKLSIGRDKKRLLSSQMHKASLGLLSQEKMIELAGQLSFTNVVEPEFLLRLRVRYGDKIVTAVQKSAKLAGSIGSENALS